MISNLLVLLAAETLTPVVASQLVEPNAARMTPREIKAFNMNVPKTHPFYIRCRASLETGSLVKTNRACKTNQQWRQSEDRGNQDARDTYDRYDSKARSGQ